MIIVDIEVPSMERTYQFSVEEQVPVETLIAELSEVICQKEQCAVQGNLAEMYLCSVENKCVLSYKETLAEQGIQNADRLLLV